MRGERLYLEDDPELGIKRTDVTGEVIQRHIDRYRRAIEYCGVKGGNWLDAGCGSGYGTEMAGEVADSVLGIDKNKRAIAYAEKHYGSNTVNFVAVDVEKLSLRRRLDVVLALEVIEHIDKAGQPPFLEAIYGLLAQGGIVVIATPMSEKGGLNSRNPYHKNEFTLPQFIGITSEYFDETSYIIDKLVDGKPTRQIFGICKKKGECFG